MRPPSDGDFSTMVTGIRALARSSVPVNVTSSPVPPAVVIETAKYIERNIPNFEILTPEAIEIIAHGNDQTSQVVGRKAKALPLPEGASIGAILRRDELLFVTSDTVVETDDRVILFLLDKRRISEVERLFQVKSIFL